MSVNDNLLTKADCVISGLPPETFEELRESWGGLLKRLDIVEERLEKLSFTDTRKIESYLRYQIFLQKLQSII